MNPNEQELIRALNMVRLSEGTRSRMREHLSAYADLHAVSASKTPSFNVFIFVQQVFSRPQPFFAGALAIMLVVSVGGGAALAAEKALPGDVLYAVKVRVTEPVASVFAGTEEAQARYHAKLAVRRVEEADILAERGDLSVAVAEDLSQKFSTESDLALAGADQLESNGNVSASIAVRSELVDNLQNFTLLALADDAIAAPENMPVASVMMAKVASAPEEDSLVMEPVVPTPTEIFRSKVVKVIARLDNSQEPIRGTLLADQTAPQAPSTLPVREVIAARTATEPTAQTLLVGTSMMKATPATTTASSTEAATTTSAVNGAQFLKNLIRIYTQKPEQGREDTEVHATASQPVVEPVPAVVNTVFGQ